MQQLQEADRQTDRDNLWISPRKYEEDYPLGKTTLYDLLGKGLIEARKLGKKTIIYRPSVDHYFSNLPKYRKVA